MPNTNPFPTASLHTSTAPLREAVAAAQARLCELPASDVLGRLAAMAAVIEAERAASRSGCWS